MGGKGGTRSVLTTPFFFYSNVLFTAAAGVVESSPDAKAAVGAIDQAVQGAARTWLPLPLR